MVSTNSSAKTSPAKRPAPLTGAAKAKPATKVAKSKPATQVGAAKTAALKTAPKAGSKVVVRRRASARKPAGVAPEQRRNYIEMAAYYIAERRGFAPGNPLEDWVQAEAEIDRLLAEGRVGH